MRPWRITIGLYPGILFGIRSYDQPEVDLHVLYLPFFIDIALEVQKEIED
jgi:hypothetical protein